MLHLIYILAFTVIALLAVSNLIRSLVTLSAESQKFYSTQDNGPNRTASLSRQQIHPELLDEQGKVIEEPLLLMRSVSVEDARSRLNALYDASPNKAIDSEE